MSDSFWKKEISFRRKPTGEWEDTPEPKAEKQSFLKKEIPFSRKSKPKPDPELEPETETETTASAPKQSFWKK